MFFFENYPTRKLNITTNNINVMILIRLIVPFFYINLTNRIIFYKKIITIGTV